MPSWPIHPSATAAPFSYRWEPTDALADDVRFKSHGLAPESAADFAFLLHGFHYLKDEGVMAIAGGISTAEFQMSKMSN